MNIKITYNWLREYLDTDADAYEMQKYLSLCGPTIESVTPVEDDFILYIEITTNRVDTASVFGIAQECVAILPRFGKKAKLIQNPLSKTFQDIRKIQKGESKKIKMNVVGKNLTERFTGIVLGEIQSQETPKLIQKRLEWCDVRSINTIVDISNYVMIALGQPNHTFDYDKIQGASLTLRLSKEGETVTTLDDKVIKLSSEDMVIEDGSGTLIDLAGIMGGKNSEIDEHTKNVFILMETYNKTRIRKTSMLTAQRSTAATYFEKGLDPQRIEPVLVEISALLHQHTKAVIASDVIDMYLEKPLMKEIEIDSDFIQKRIGVHIDTSDIMHILTSLGFSIKENNNIFTVTVPSYRLLDVRGKQDIVEEVARIYGYQNIPNIVQTTTYVKQPKDVETQFKVQYLIKYFLKHIGLHEVMNYSMVSKSQLEKLYFDPSKTLKLANTISEDIEYMRPSLFPSLVQNITQNQGKFEHISVFELSKIYIPREGDLPEEKSILAFATTESFTYLKGIIEALIDELHITKLSFQPSSSHHLLTSQMQAHILVSGKRVGVIGMLKPSYKDAFGIKQDVMLTEIECDALWNHFNIVGSYVPPPQFAVLKRDVTFTEGEYANYSDLEKKAYQVSNYVVQIDMTSQYENNITIQFTFTAPDHHMTEAEATKIISDIKEKVKPY